MPKKKMLNQEKQGLLTLGRLQKANFKWFRLHLVVKALYHKAPLSFSNLGQRGYFLVESTSFSLINHCV